MIRSVRLVITNACLLLGMVSGAQAVYIERTITVDGDVSDWTSPTDITNNTNPYQFSTDGQDGNIPTDDADDPIGQTGRDLKKFSFTWDNTYLYFYVERWASTNNIVHWFFYIDSNADGYMQTGEKVFDVSWQGNTGDTDAELYNYVQSASGPDLLSGDGVGMPGSLGTSTTVYTNVKGGVTSGAGDGVQMESRISWAALGLTGPANIKFHISSANNTNLPGSILDNMDGPAGGQLFPQDLQVDKTASVATIKALQPFSYTVTVYNAAITDFTNVVISDVLPAQVTYVSHTAQAGTTFDDSDSNSIPDEWNIPSIAANATYTLTINVTAGNVPVTMNVDNTATLTASDQTDEDNSNDTATATVSIEPIPVLTMVKYASSATADPGGNVTYTLDITNTGGDDGYNVVVEDRLSPYVMFGLNSYGAGQPFQFVEGTPASGLSINNTTYSNDNGVTYTYTPVSGGGGAPAGYDANVTNWRIEMTGTMADTGGNFDLNYQVMVE